MSTVIERGGVEVKVGALTEERHVRRFNRNGRVDAIGSS